MNIKGLGATLLVAFGLVLSSCLTYAQDWGGLQRFAAANAALAEPAAGQPRVVLLGVSITEEWLRLRPDFFSSNGYVGRGISGQVSAQMLVRFRQDVIDLKPAVVVINAGTNDVAENQGPYSEDFAFGNIVSMTELAQANGIAVVLTSVLPAAAFRWRPAITDAADKIAALNVRIKAYAAAKGIPYVDYYTPMVVSDPSRALNPAYSNDGVHPVPAGYEVMEPLVMEAIATALAAASQATASQDAACQSSSACGCCR
ncbi:MAG: SGNH/GDSL hydrolase family protein [Bacteroidales bacterium]|nr:SGNH/GDSL hydrolase family protein [Bacteroidales bacterium]